MWCAAGSNSGSFQPATRYIERSHCRDTFLQGLLRDRLSDCDVLLVPTMPITAPRLADVDVGGSEDMPAVVLRISEEYETDPLISRSAGVERAVRFPSSGLPTAFQLVGRPFDEATLCKVGRTYKQRRRRSCVHDIAQ